MTIANNHACSFKVREEVDVLSFNNAEPLDSCMACSIVALTGPLGGMALIWVHFSKPISF